MDAPAAGSLPDAHEPGAKGLKVGALGFVSSVVIGVSSTAPGYSLAASLGLVVAAVGLGSPAVMWVSFIPMLLVATSYYYLNRADPDCGTIFSWGAKAFGPVTGWLGGWALFIADVVVMANLAQIAGLYSFLLFNANHLAASTFWVTFVGVVWIAIMTWICYVGIEVSAKSQWFLLGAEISILVIFSVVALIKVYTGHPTGSIHPSLSWLDPTAISSTNALISGVLGAIFIYWGWDSLVSVNEETEDAERTPGIAAVASTFILVGIYVVVSIAAQAFHGSGFLVKNSDDVLSALGKGVLGPGWDKLLIIAVLTSASASCQTTILPTSRTTLSMASHGALPKYFARIHPRYLTPSTSTLWMGIISIVWYVFLTIVSQNILYDSILALGLLIAFYYGLDGFACAWYFRRNMKTLKGVFLAGVMPLLGGISLFYVLIESGISLAKPANSTAGTSWFGVGPPLVITVGLMLLGVVLMLLQWKFEPAFFRRRPELPPAELRLVSPPIVLGYDGSPHAEAAPAKAAELARAGGAPVVVVFAYYISPLGGGDVRDYKKALEQVAGEQTGKALAALDAAGVSATARHLSGRPGEAIVAVAGEVGAAMIVVGSPSRGPRTAAFLGSVVLDLVQRSPVPLLVVPV